jgi:hypothetical protein
MIQSLLHLDGLIEEGEELETQEEPERLGVWCTAQVRRAE